jgi:prephenate dehydrogenase
LLHDKAIAVTIIMPHIIALGYGMLVDDMSLSLLESYGGPSFDYLIEYTKKVYSEDKSLLYDLINNHAANEVINRFLGIIKDLQRKIENRSEFDRLIDKINEALEK